MSSNAMADGWKWSHGFRVSPSAAMTVGGQQIEDASMGNYAPSVALRDRLYSDLKTGIHNLAAKKLTSFDGYQWHSIDIKGPIEMALTPNGTALPSVSLSQFAVVATVNVKRSWGPFTGSCTFVANSGPINVSGALNISEGSITNIRISNFAPGASKDCSTNVSWIPVIGSIVDSIVDSKIDGVLRDGVSQAIAASNSTFKSISFAGLDKAIPPVKFTYKQWNFDAGQYLINNLPYLINSTNVSLRFSPPLGPMYGPNPYVSPVGKKIITQKDEAIRISFPSAPYGGISFAVYENTLFNSAWRCDIPRPVCAPPNDL